MRHPIVAHASVTKRKLLYINRNYATRIVGTIRSARTSLLPFLFDHVAIPCSHCGSRWQAGLDPRSGTIVDPALCVARLSRAVGS
jgi:alpha-ketoglutarate-dependent taurine dioxygenase